MMHATLVMAHLLGALMLGAAIAACLVTDARARRAPTPAQLADALRTATLVQQRLLLPGILALGVSGVALVALYWGLAGVLGLPWLAAMVLLFVIEGLRANTLGRRHALRLRQLTDQALALGRITPELDRARGDRRAIFARWLELAALVLMLALGLLRPRELAPIVAGAVGAVLAAAIAAYVVSPGSATPSRRSSASVDAEGRA